MIWPWTPKPKPRVYLNTEDDLAFLATFRKAEEWKIAEMKKNRNLQTILWDRVNYPAACWKARKRIIHPMRFCAGMDENEGVS